MRGLEIFQKPSYREISPMRDRPMRGPPVVELFIPFLFFYVPTYYISMYNKTSLNAFLLSAIFAINHIFWTI